MNRRQLLIGSAIGAAGAAASDRANPAERMAILSCADSRVDPGWVFASGSGELFQVRNAGNTAFNDGIASLE